MHSRVISTTLRRRNGLLTTFSVTVVLTVAGSSAATPDSHPVDATSGPRGAHVIAVDAKGLPLVCGFGTAAARDLAPTAPGTLPANSRGWEVIPGVIRADGVQSFRLEVDTNGPVESVDLTYLPYNLIVPSRPTTVLHDDGLGEDRVAGDFVFTAGPFRWDSSSPSPACAYADPSDPDGACTQSVGYVTVTETGGAAWHFICDPSVGLLRADIPDETVLSKAPDVAVTAHVVNVQTNQRRTQRYLRNVGYPSNLWDLTIRVYQVLPDLTDFFMLFSTNKIEDMQGSSGRNLVAGTHIPVRCDFTGTGRNMFDYSNDWGSQGVLQGVNILDAYGRGIKSNVAVHELCHQWVAFIDPALGLSDGVHYWNWTSAASLVGGFEWLSGPSHTYILNCDEGRNGAHRAPPLDQYMMGLVDGAQVPVLRVTTSPGFPGCGATITNYSEVTIANIQARHGVRSPGPAGAQRQFRVAFLAESHERLLNATEMTFYEIMAAQFTRALPPEEPDPNVGFNWVPVTRFFGGGTVWEAYPTGVEISDESSRGRGDGLNLVLRATPNPAPRSRGIELVVLGSKAQGPAPMVEIFDALGHRVAAIGGRAEAGGAHLFVWNGKDDAGQDPASGVYFARARQGGIETARKIVLLD